MNTISFPTDKGKLAGVIHKPTGLARDRILLICHGFRGSKEGGGRAVALAEQASEMGFTAVRFDFTPTTCLTQQISEISAVVAYCRRFLGKPIVLLGRSMGGSASLAFSAIDCKLAGLCLWATPTDLHESFRLSLGENYNLLLAGESIHIEDEYGCLDLTGDFINDFDKYDLVACVRAIQGLPLLMLHGDQDSIVPVSQAQKLFRQAGEPKKLMIIAGADHHFSQHSTQAADVVLSWLQALE
jgi:uncharacterized protein